MKQEHRINPFHRESRHQLRSRRHPEWELPFAMDDPLWREWNQSKQRKEKY